MATVASSKGHRPRPSLAPHEHPQGLASVVDGGPVPILTPVVVAASGGTQLDSYEQSQGQSYLGTADGQYLGSRWGTHPGSLRFLSMGCCWLSHPPWLATVSARDRWKLTLGVVDHSLSRCKLRSGCSVGC